MWYDKEYYDDDLAVDAIAEFLKDNVSDASLLVFMNNHYLNDDYTIYWMDDEDFEYMFSNKKEAFDYGMSSYDSFNDSDRYVCFRFDNGYVESNDHLDDFGFFDYSNLAYTIWHEDLYQEFDDYGLDDYLEEKALKVEEI